MKYNYLEYLESDHWQNLRVLCRARFNEKCAICHDEKTLQCHHRIYRRKYQDTVVEDLILLCDSCHKMVHKDGSETLTADALASRYFKFFEKHSNRIAIEKKNVNPIVEMPDSKPRKHWLVAAKEEKLQNRLNRLLKRQKNKKNPQRQKEIVALSDSMKKFTTDYDKSFSPVQIRHNSPRAMPVYNWAKKQWEASDETHS